MKRTLRLVIAIVAMLSFVGCQTNDHDRRRDGHPHGGDHHQDDDHEDHDDGRDDDNDRDHD